jgi:hypothetical protein
MFRLAPQMINSPGRRTGLQTGVGNIRPLSEPRPGLVDRHHQRARMP